MRIGWMVWFAASLIVAVGPASASTCRTYLLGGPGEMGTATPDAGGQATITINDVLLPTVGGFYCQDVNSDGICGDDGTVSGTVESAQSFCVELTLDDGSVSGNANWDPASDVFVFVDGPIDGLPTFSACGTLAPGILGTVCLS